jgi:hypothetical protein
MQERFELAAFRAGWHAARSGMPFAENPFSRGPLARFRNHWGRGWSAHVDRACRYTFVPKNSHCMEAFHV